MGLLSPLSRVSPAVFSSEGSGEVSASRFYHVVDRIQFFVVVELRSHFHAGGQLGACAQPFEAHISCIIFKASHGESPSYQTPLTL